MSFFLSTKMLSDGSTAFETATLQACSIGPWPTQGLRVHIFGCLLNGCRDVGERQNPNVEEEKARMNEMEMSDKRREVGGNENEGIGRKRKIV